MGAPAFQHMDVTLFLLARFLFRLNRNKGSQGAIWFFNKRTYLKFTLYAFNRGARETFSHDSRRICFDARAVDAVRAVCRSAARSA